MSLNSMHSELLVSNMKLIAVLMGGFSLLNRIFRTIPLHYFHQRVIAPMEPDTVKFYSTHILTRTSLTFGKENFPKVLNDHVIHVF